MNSLSSGGAGLIPVKQLDAIRNARKKVVASAPIHANERIFASYAKRTDVLVLVDYYADWCPPCRKIAPFLSKLAAQHGDKVIILKVNTDREQALASRAGVRSIPDVRLMHGGKQLERYVGGRPYRDYEAIVLKHEKRLTKSSPFALATAKANAPAPRPALVKSLPSAAPRSSKPEAESPGRGSIIPLEKD